MKTPLRRSSPARGTTLLELLFVVLIISIMALLLLPVLGKAKARAKRVACTSNLHQIGIAYHEFAHDHRDQFPFQVMTNDGGTLEFTRAGFAMSGEFYFAFRHFQALSNILDTTRLLLCAADTRTNADHFQALRNHNLSYFVGVNAEYSRPESILSGDRNISSDGFASGSIVRLNPGAPAEWTSGCHEFNGNLLFADGHVEHSNNEGLALTLQRAGSQPSHLLPPIIQPGSVDDSVPLQPTVVAALQQFFDTAPATQRGGAGNAGATPDTTPAPPPNLPEARPASVPKPTPPPPAMAASRPAPKADGNIATNRAPVAAAQDASRPAGKAETPKAVPRGTSGADTQAAYAFNFYFFLFQPGRYFWGWLFALLLAVVAAFFLGWHLQRSRAKKRLAMAADPASPTA